MRDFRLHADDDRSHIGGSIAEPRPTLVRPLRKEDEVQHPMTDKLRDKARALGLDRLTDEHLEQFERATTGMERHLKRLPRDMPPPQEPAHIYRAKRDIP